MDGSVFARAAPFARSAILAAAVAAAAWGADVTTTLKPHVHAERGMRAMQESFNRPEAIVEAALAFVEARRLYQTTQDVERVCEMQAYLFWCKRRMNLDDVKAFLGHQKDDAATRAALADLEAVTAKPVPPAEAQAYFDRATAFAKADPKQHLPIAIRWFEVAERFQGTELSLTAQRHSLDAMQRHLAALPAQTAAPAAPKAAPAAPTGATAARAPVPAADAVKAAVAQVKQAWKTDYAKARKPEPRRALAARLLAQSASSDGDAVLQWALLSEARELAVAGGDPVTAAAAMDRMAARFAVTDAAAQKRSTLGRVGTAASTAMIRLLDHPDAADACVIVGRWCCFELERWDEGVRYLARGNDPQLKAVAAADLADPSDGARMAEIADGWYRAAMKEKGDARQAGLSRSLHWYARCAPLVAGLSQEVAATRIAEISDALPDHRLDYRVIPLARWEKIAGTVFDVPGDRDKVESGVVLAPGQVLRVAPRPSDTWESTGSWTGATGGPGMIDGMREGEMVWAIESGPRRSVWAHEIRGEGRLLLGANRPKNGGKGGTIRVKIVVVPQD